MGTWCYVSGHVVHRCVAVMNAENIARSFFSFLDCVTRGRHFCGIFLIYWAFLTTLLAGIGECCISL